MYLNYIYIFRKDSSKSYISSTSRINSSLGIYITLKATSKYINLTF